jgi:CRP/FNR family cyclic AMP-dependent transcriptional regulator
MKNDLAYEFPSELLTSLQVLGERKIFRAGEVLVREGEASDQLYVLLSGEVKVFTHKPNGRELVYNTLHSCEYFGELALDGHSRSASVSAMSTVECLVIDGEVMRAVTKDNPDFLFLLFVKVMGLLRRATQKLKSVALDDVYERIVALIEEEAIEEVGTRHLPRMLTQQEIAKRIGASREMVNHVFRDLTRGGFVARNPNQGLAILKDLPKHW